MDNSTLSLEWDLVPLLSPSPALLPLLCVADFTPAPMDVPPSSDSRGTRGWESPKRKFNPRTLSIREARHCLNNLSHERWVSVLCVREC